MVFTKAGGGRRPGGACTPTRSYKNHLPSLALTLPSYAEPKNGHEDRKTCTSSHRRETECGIGGSRSRCPPVGGAMLPLLRLPGFRLPHARIPAVSPWVAMLTAPICSPFLWAREPRQRADSTIPDTDLQKTRLLEARTTLIYTSDEVRYLLKSPPTLTRNPTIVRALSMSFGHPPLRSGPAG